MWHHQILLVIHNEVSVWGFYKKWCFYIARLINTGNQSARPASTSTQCTRPTSTVPPNVQGPAALPP
ncbi:hypothetical protein LSAT2_025529, partial [Lamellibrachia satsuma]